VLTPSQAANDVGVWIDAPLLLAQEAWGIVFFEPNQLVPPPFDTNIPHGANTVLQQGATAVGGSMCQVDFWAGMQGAADGATMWKDATLGSGAGHIAVGGTISAKQGFYWGGLGASDQEFVITRDRVDLRLDGSPAKDFCAGLALTPTPAGFSPADAQLTGRYISAGDTITSGTAWTKNCRTFTVNCLDDSDLDGSGEVDLVLRTRQHNEEDHGGRMTKIRVQAEASTESLAELFAGVGAAQPDNALADNLYGIFAKIDPDTHPEGEVYLQLGGQMGDAGAEIYKFVKPTPPQITKTFIIPHPLDNLRDSTELLHSCVEAPTVDNIYRGSCRLMNGKGLVNLDSNDRYQMTQGTFQALNKDPQVHVTNNESFDRVKGEIVGNELHIICENPDSDANIAWLVIGTRQDPSIRQCPKTDDVGNLITERPRN